MVIYPWQLVFICFTPLGKIDLVSHDIQSSFSYDGSWSLSQILRCLQLFILCWIKFFLLNFKLHFRLRAPTIKWLLTATIDTWKKRCRTEQLARWNIIKGSVMISSIEKKFLESCCKSYYWTTYKLKPLIAYKRWISAEDIA